MTVRRRMTGLGMRAVRDVGMRRVPLMGLGRGRSRFGMPVPGAVFGMRRFQLGGQLFALGVERGDPMLLFGQGLQTRCLAAEGFVDFVPVDLGHHVAAAIGDPLQTMPPGLVPLLQLGQPGHGVVGQLRHRIERFATAIELFSLQPAGLDLGGRRQHPQPLIQLDFLFFQRRGGVVQIVVLFDGGQIFGRRTAQGRDFAA